MPRGRTNIDFECEFAVVIGRPAKYVPTARAADYIFGYTAHHDVSDRGGRGDRKMGGSDWLIGKNHDTFGPLGPYIVPKEFLSAPMKTRHTMSLNGMVMQDSNTDRMSHNIHELLSYASNIVTLNPGDVIAGGSPAGTNIERAEPRWMRAGDTAKCEIEGIGALNNPVVAEATVSSRYGRAGSRKPSGFRTSATGQENTRRTHGCTARRKEHETPMERGVVGGADDVDRAGPDAHDDECSGGRRPDRGYRARPR